MDISIGIRDGGAPLNVEVDMSAEELLAAAKAAITDNHPFELTAHDGAQVLVPASAIGYIKIAQEEQRRVGFGFV